MKVNRNSHLLRADEVMRNVWLRMYQDFSGQMGGQLAPHAYDCIKRRDYAGFRTALLPSRENLPIPLFKRLYQLEAFLKRYRFQSDMYTDDELEQLTAEKNMADIERLAIMSEWKPITKKVLRTARSICREILGEFDPEEHVRLCRFARRASVGNQYRCSYLDIKIGGDGPITGSKDHIKWFNNYLLHDHVLRDVLTESGLEKPQLWEICGHLVQTGVPKSWKTNRLITPNTLLGSFHSFGLGTYITELLEDYGVSIRRGQAIHRALLPKMSLRRNLVTADLSNASGSITSRHVRAVVPYRWYRELNRGRLRYEMTTTGSIIPTPTFAGMGIGFTFPLQTLMFYCVLCAIRQLTGVRGRISVYGDDLIYPRSMHKYVLHIFKDLQWVINNEKTFVESDFRESCGADFYRGVDCRPASPASKPEGTSRAHFASFIFKLYNGLLERWDDVEIPSVLHYLRTELACGFGKILYVPDSYPAYAGIKQASPHVEKCWWRPDRPPRYITKSKHAFGPQQCWSFECLTVNQNLRLVQTQYPYYWDTMRASAVAENARDSGDMYSGARPRLIWRKIMPPPRHYRSRINGKRLQKLEPCVQRKGSEGSLSSNRVQVLTWI
jgi:hypothetical protein